jgi:hypothetical protein
MVNKLCVASRSTSALAPKRCLSSFAYEEHSGRFFNAHVATALFLRAHVAIFRGIFMQAESWTLHNEMQAE